MIVVAYFWGPNALTQPDIHAINLPKSPKTEIKTAHKSARADVILFISIFRSMGRLSLQALNTIPQFSFPSSPFSVVTNPNF